MPEIKKFKFHGIYRNYVILHIVLHIWKEMDSRCLEVKPYFFFCTIPVTFAFRPETRPKAWNPNLKLIIEKNFKKI
jgi:hypothetical protein